MTIYETIVSALQNQVLTGIIGGSAVVSLFWAMKSVPQAAWDFIKWRWTCSLTVFNEDAAFERVSEWVANLPKADRVRNLRLTSAWDSSTQTEDERLSPGLGHHLFWYKGRPIVIQRTLPDKSAVGGAKRLEDIKISTIGGSPEILRLLLDEVKAARREMGGKTIDVYIHRNRWRLICRKPKRSIASVVLPERQKARLLADVGRFLGARAWYSQRGVPYRRGYLFKGPPGCGKSSLAMALASEFSRPIYALNLGSINGDDELIEAVADVPEHAILLIEDVDAAEATVTKRRVEEKPGVPTDTTKDPQVVSLSALLNVLDGVFARDGRILIMTTNHPEKVDPALLRPGRADLHEHIGLLEDEEGLVLCERFFGSTRAAQFSRGTVYPIAAAELQERLLQAASSNGQA